MVISVLPCGVGQAPEGENTDLGMFPAAVDARFFLDCDFRLGSARSATFVLLLASRSREAHLLDGYETRPVAMSARMAWPI